MVATHGLMETAALLRFGNPMLKAHKISELIDTYNVDIKTLDEILAGNTPDPATSQYEQMLNEKLAPFQNFIQQQEIAKQQQEAQIYQQADHDIAAFAADPQHEFFDHVRWYMATILDVARANGQEITLDQAYEQACFVHPEVRHIAVRKELERHLKKNKSATREKKNAASSIKSASVDAGETVSSGNDIIDDLREAAAQHLSQGRV